MRFPILVSESSLASGQREDILSQVKDGNSTNIQTVRPSGEDNSSLMRMLRVIFIFSVDLRDTLTNTLRKKLQVKLIRAVCFLLRMRSMVIGIMVVRVFFYHQRKVRDSGIYMEATLRY